MNFFSLYFRRKLKLELFRCFYEVIYVLPQVELTFPTVNLQVFTNYFKKSRNELITIPLNYLLVKLSSLSVIVSCPTDSGVQKMFLNSPQILNYFLLCMNKLIL